MITLIFRLIPHLSLVLCMGFHSRVVSQNLPFSASGKAVDDSLRREVARSIDRGNQWLLEHQDASGFWVSADQLSTTANALMALQRDPEEHHAGIKMPVIEEGYRYLNSCIQKNGGIYTDHSRRLIDTSSAMLALLMKPHASQEETIKNARDFIMRELEVMAGQSEGDTKMADILGLDSGGVSQLLSMMHGLEALCFTQALYGQSHDAFLESGRESILHFLGQYQYPVSVSRNTQFADFESMRGGFMARLPALPAQSTPSKIDKEWTLPAGSYGFAGLLSYLYMDVELSDPRVEGTQDWLIGNYTLKQNPGLGQRELFFYYLCMAKAWSAFKLTDLPDGPSSGKDWRHMLALRLMDLQQADGSWVNARDSGHALLAFEIIYSGL